MEGTRAELLIATRNAGKAREFAELLRGLRALRVRHLAEFPGTTEVEETGETFAANATLKARAYAAQTGLWTLADDSGLEVDALGGKPGVHSARYAGPKATDAERVARLLEELRHTPDESRGARFVCVVALARPTSAEVSLFEGTCEGRIARAPHGAGGFGYDPIFVPDGHAHTFGELPAEIKNRLSHRARALSAAASSIHELLGARP